MTFAMGFEQIEKELQYWCVTKKPYRTIIHTLCKLDTNIGCDYLPLWFTHQAQTYSFASVLCDRDELRQWDKAHPDLLPEARKAVTTWENDSPIWCYFTILDTPEKNFFLISDRLTGASLLLYSPYLALSMIAAPDKRKKHFIALIAPNGSCYQSFGVIHSNNLGASDLDFFCTMLDQKDYMSKGFSTVVNQNYIPFISIDEVTYVPSMTHAGTWMKHTFNKIHIDSFDPATLVGGWEVETKGNLVKATLVSDGGVLRSVVDDKAFWDDISFSQPSLFIDKKSGNGWLTTSGRQSYDPFTTILRHQFPMIPLDKVIVPDYVVSPAMLHIIMNQQRQAPWTDYLKPFSSVTVNAEAIKNQEMVNDHLRSLGTPALLGRGFYAIKDEVGLTMGKGPVRVGTRLETPLDKNSQFFHIDETDTISKAFLSAWYKKFPDTTPALNLFLLLLWYHSGCYKTIEAYASELVKQIPDIKTHFPSFYMEFAAFIRSVMIPMGLLDMESKGSVRIRATERFGTTLRKR